MDEKFLSIVETAIESKCWEVLDTNGNGYMMRNRYFGISAMKRAYDDDWHFLVKSKPDKIHIINKKLSRLFETIHLYKIPLHLIDCINNQNRRREVSMKNFVDIFKRKA